jgi:hypothetical protein
MRTSKEQQMTTRTDTHSRRARIAARLTVATLAGALSAIAVVVASGGSEKSSDFSPAAALRATGPLSIGNSREGSAVLSASGMAPGQSQTGVVDIQNASSMHATFALAQSNVTGTVLAGSLSLSVVDCGTFAGATAPTCDTGDPQVYSGALNGLPSTPLGSFAAGVTHRYRFAVAFPNGTPAHDNPLQGLSASVQFDWSAEAPEPTTTTTEPPPLTTTTTTGTGTGTGTGTLNPSGNGSSGAPKLSLALPTSSSNTSQLAFVAICDRACTLAVGGTLTVPGAAKVYKLKPVTKALKAGVRVTVRVPFSRAARQALAKAVKRGKRASVRLRMTTRSGSASSTTRRTVVIKKKR